MSTVDYYNQNAEQYFRETINVNMEDLYEPFLALIPSGGHILDAGCGSGRDSLYFMQKGYKVTAFDASYALAGLSTQLLNQPVLHTTFQHIAFDDRFEGIWACASLLHVPRTQIDDVLMRLAKALKPSGVLYASFKYGDREYEREGRFFNSYNESSLVTLTSRHTKLASIKVWTSPDQIRGRRNEKWLNTLLRKVAK